MNSISDRPEALPTPPQATLSSVDTIRTSLQTLYAKVQQLESQNASLEQANRKMSEEKESLVKKYANFKPNSVGILVPSTRSSQATSTLLETIKSENEQLRTKVREGLQERRNFQRDSLQWQKTNQEFLKKIRELEKGNRDLKEQNEKITAEKVILQSRLQLPSMAFHILHPQVLEKAHLVAENHYLRKRIGEIIATRRP